MIYLVTRRRDEPFRLIHTHSNCAQVCVRIIVSLCIGRNIFAGGRPSGIDIDHEFINDF